MLLCVLRPPLAPETRAVFLVIPWKDAEGLSPSLVSAWTRALAPALRGHSSLGQAAAVGR